MTTPLHRAAHWHRPLVILVASMAVLAVLTAVGMLADPRMLTGVPIWNKPFKFAVSFVLYGVTLAWMLSLLPRRSRLAERAATVVVASSLVEMVIIAGQAARGQTSHYNVSTLFNGVLWQAMGASVMVLFVAHLVIGLVLLRARIADRAAAYAVRLGLGLSLLGMAAAIPMVTPIGVGGIADGGAHTVGLSDGGPGLPLVGWSTVGGDLRIGHFVGLHALQALPLLGLLLGRTRLAETVRTRLLLIAGAAYGVLTVMLTAQALRGQSIVHPDALTLTGFGVLALATAAATALVLSRSPRRALDVPRPVADRDTARALA